MLIVGNSIQERVFIPVGVPFVVAISTLVLAGLYFRNRLHRHGNLIIEPSQQGMVVVSALAFAYTAQYAQINKHVASVFLPFLVGSAITTLLGLAFASVADAWEAVGSGQFQMISLDTAALLVYVVAPVLVLASIACNKYGEIVYQTTRVLLQNSFITDDFISQQERPPEQVMISGLYILLSLATCIGMAVINMLCPLNAYLSCRAYLNGQLSTRKVALCVHFKSILGDSDEARMKENADFYSSNKKFQVLNVFVTADELRLYSDAIRKLRTAGHSIGICSNTVKGIAQAYDEYEKLFKAKPLWYHVGSSSDGRRPAMLKAADSLSLKVAFWSTHIGVTSRQVLLHKGLIDLRRDVARNGGGSFVYLTNDWNDAREFLLALEALVLDLGSDSREVKKFTFAALSDVAKEDPPMTL